MLGNIGILENQMIEIIIKIHILSNQLNLFDINSVFMRLKLSTTSIKYFTFLIFYFLTHIVLILFLKSIKTINIII